MSFTKATTYLQKRGLGENVMEFDCSLATVVEAAAAVGCASKQIAKTLSFLVGGEAVLVVVAGDCKIDNAKFKAHFATKAKMLDADVVEETVGHAVGGVCPFGVNENVAIYLDESLKRLDTLYPSCGSVNSAVKLTLAQLEEAVEFKAWVDVCRVVE